MNITIHDHVDSLEEVIELNSGKLLELDRKVARLLGKYILTRTLAVEGKKVKQEYISSTPKPDPNSNYFEGVVPPYSSYLGATTKVLIEMEAKEFQWQMGTNSDGSYFATVSVPVGPGVYKNYHRCSDKVETALCLAFVRAMEAE